MLARLWRSLKYEDLYLKSYETVTQLHRGLSDYFVFYNQERPHQGLENRLPADLYFTKETPIENKKQFHLKFALTLGSTFAVVKSCKGERSKRGFEVWLGEREG